MPVVFLSVGTLSEKEAEALRVAERASHVASERDRIRAVLYSAQGRRVSEIAPLLFVHTLTVRRAIKRYLKRGLEGLREGKHTGRPPVFSPSARGRRRRQA